MKNRSLFLVALLAVLVLGIGGCANMRAAVPDTVAKLACGTVGGVAAHSLAAAASWPWTVASTVTGVGVGSYVCDGK